MNQSKSLETFLHKVFEKIPNVHSKQNGSGWGTDHGADLILTFTPIMKVNLTLVVQVKSYQGPHKDLTAVDQIVEAMDHYNADGGLLITTGEATEELEAEISSKAEETNKHIDLIAGTDVARFVLKYAPEMLVGEIA